MEIPEYPIICVFGVTSPADTHYAWPPSCVDFVRVHRLSSNDFLGDIVSALKHNVVASSVGPGYSTGVTCDDLVMEQLLILLSIC